VTPARRDAGPTLAEHVVTFPTGAAALVEGGA
jgi:hypothetical protein